MRVSFFKKPRKIFKHIFTFSNAPNFKQVANNIADGLSDRDQVDFTENIREHLKDNLLLLDVFYEDLNFLTNSETKADTVPSLVSDLGGQLGLWLGCSILTIVEIIYCCFVVVPKGCYKKIKKTKQGKNSG